MMASCGRCIRVPGRDYLIECLQFLTEFFTFTMGQSKKTVQWMEKDTKTGKDIVSY
jgi:hypothetical protein